MSGSNDFLRHFPRRLAGGLAATAAALAVLVRLDAGMQPAALTDSAADPTEGAIAIAGDPATSAPGSSSNNSTGTDLPSAATQQPSSSEQILTGSAVSTRYGTVQVKITVAGGEITEVSAVRLPSGGRDGQISAYVEPILRTEALDAQSANIDTVSGATYTSEGYIESLQSALDQVS